MKPFKQSRKQLVYLGAIASSIAFVIYCAVSSPEQIGWTGFKEDTEVSKTEKILENGKEITVVTKNVSGKTLWDWLSVLGVPLSLALLGFWFQQLSAKQADIEKEIAKCHEKEEMLQVYFDRLSTLLVDKNLIAIATKVDRSSDTETEKRELLLASRSIIRARTVSILRRLGEDRKRKSSVIQFLIEAEVVNKLKLKDLIGDNLRGADLSSCHLSSIDLSGIDLSGVNLRGVDLSGIDLSRANLSNADLRDVNLVSANLGDALLRGTDL